MSFPKILHPHPGPKTLDAISRLKDTEMKASLSFGMSKNALIAKKAFGSRIEDVDGNIFLDFVAGYGSLNAGHCHPKIVDAVCTQANQVHQAMSMGSEVRIKMQEKLLSLFDGPKRSVILGTGGSEAAEIALKIARRETGKSEIVAFTGAFHGRTLGSLALMGRKIQRDGIGSLIPGIHHIPYPYLYRSIFGENENSCIEGTISLIEEFLSNPSSGWGNVAAIIIEPVQGNGGMIPAPIGFLKRLRKLCNKHSIVLIFDEVMSGFCRTGKTFAYQHEEDTEPDIVVLGKSISAGFPLSACVVNSSIVSSNPGTEGSTYGGNLVSCAASLAAMEVYEEESYAERAKFLGEYFLEKLISLKDKFQIVGEIRGRGLMVGIEMVEDRNNKNPLSKAKRCSEKALEKGLLLYPGGHYLNVLAFLPPIVIEKENIDTAVLIIEEVLTEISNEN
ncbi:MAG: 4-aminobutyrate--2-oxoglutarate transaminase [Nitrospinae bacterium]|nr:4-aminobutyrate--2-oxoglutarate transaminase [Nitrospinota bacterium]